MAVTITSDFKIREELVYSMFINRVITKTAAFNAQSNNVFRMDNQFLSGEVPKTSQIDEPANLIDRRDVFGAITDLEDTKLTESSVGGPKIRKTLKPIAITQDTIDEKGWTEEDIARVVAEMYSKQMLEDSFKNALAILVALIGASSSKFRQTDGTISPKDMVDALDFFDPMDALWALTVMHSTTYNAGLRQAYDDKVQAPAELAIRNGLLYSLGRPVLKIKDTTLDLADASSGAGNHAGKWILYLPQLAFVAKVTRTPKIVQQLVTGKSQLFLRFQGEYNHVLQPKGHEWTSAVKNPTAAQLAAAGNWADRAKSHQASCGFGIQVLNKALPA